MKNYSYLKDFMIWQYPQRYTEPKFFGKSVTDRGKARAYLVYWLIKKDEKESEKFVAVLDAWTSLYPVTSFGERGEIRKAVRIRAWNDWVSYFRKRNKEDIISVAPTHIIPQQFKKNGLRFMSERSENI